MNKRNQIAWNMIITGVIAGTIITIILAINQFNIPTVDLTFRDFCYGIRGEKYGFMFWLFRILTEFGFIYVILIGWLVFAILTKFDIRSVVLGFGTLITWAANNIIKTFFNRERPIEEKRWMTEESLSFPSGHSMTATFFYGIIIYYVLTSEELKERKKIKIALTIIFAVIIPIVMFSRMILGVHYFTDVIVGFFYGEALVGIAILLDVLFNKKGFKFIKRLIDKKRNEN